MVGQGHHPGVGSWPPITPTSLAPASLDHLVGLEEERRGDRETKGLSYGANRPSLRTGHGEYREGLAQPTGCLAAVA